jgi:Uma2 family endonuclease
MSELLEFEEESKMGSLYHGLTQGLLITALSQKKKFTVIPELSLDVSQIDLKPFGIKAKDKLIPDICIYPKGQFKKKGRDFLKVSEIPLLAIEVISPEQGTNEIIAKFEAYFSLGIKSCWLVDPLVDVVHVYSEPNQHRTYDMNDTEVFDEVMDIHLPIQDIFAW